MPDAALSRLLLVLAVVGLFGLTWLAARRLEARRLRRLAPRLPGEAALDGRPVLLYFWGDYCLDCTRQRQALQTVQARCPEVELVGVRAVEEPELAGHYRVFTLPATVVLRDGGVYAVHRGFVPAERLMREVNGARVRDQV